MPLIEDFRSTTYWKAFILNAFANALVTVFALVLNSKLKQVFVKHDSIVATTLLTLIFTFIAAISAYFLMYALFGFGSGMLSISEDAPPGASLYRVEEISKPKDK